MTSRSRIFLTAALAATVTAAAFVFFTRADDDDTGKVSSPSPEETSPPTPLEPLPTFDMENPGEAAWKIEEARWNAHRYPHDPRIANPSLWGLCSYVKRAEEELQEIRETGYHLVTPARITDVFVLAVQRIGVTAVTKDYPSYPDCVRDDVVLVEEEKPAARVYACVEGKERIAENRSGEQILSPPYAEAGHYLMIHTTEGWRLLNLRFSKVGKGCFDE